MDRKEESKRIPHLYHWYISETKHADGTSYVMAFGNVAGHQRLSDTMFIHTSRIEGIKSDEETEQVVIRTINTEYHCRWSDCDFSKFDTCEFLPDFRVYAEKYGKKKTYMQDDDTILLVLSDHERYIWKMPETA